MTRRGRIERLMQRLHAMEQERLKAAAAPLRNLRLTAAACTATMQPVTVGELAKVVADAHRADGVFDFAAAWSRHWQRKRRPSEPAST